MAYYDTFKDIKVGDKVFLISFGGFVSYKIATVSKVNKKTFQVNESRHTFNKFDGNVYRDYCSRYRVEPYNEEKYYKYVREEYERERRNKLFNAIANTKFSDLPTEKLEKIHEIINS